MEKETCNYVLKTVGDNISMKVWECDNPSCLHIESALYRFKYWKYCPYCGRLIETKEGIK